MIRITLELVSARGAARDRLLGVAYLANTGVKALDGTYSYKLWLSKTLSTRTEETWKTGRAAIDVDDVDLLARQPDGQVIAFDNVKRGAWDLLYLALKAVVGSRNP